MSYKYNFAMIISDSQQKYVVLKAMRRSNGITKNLLMKKLKSKVYVSFRISLYFQKWLKLRKFFTLAPISQKICQTVPFRQVARYENLGGRVIR